MLQTRLFANIKGIGISLIPRYFFQKQLGKIFKNILKDKELESLKNRLDYYNKINNFFDLKKGEKIGKLPYKKTSYSFDAYEASKYFKDYFVWQKEFGDTTHICNQPSICKSRPLREKWEENANNILLKLDKNRHFNFVKDKNKYEDKKDQAIFRGAVCQSHRRDFFAAYFGKDFCELGDTVKGSKWQKNFMSKSEQMKYKFIISLEGNDVASNLKWAMHSRSLILAQGPLVRAGLWRGV